MIVETVTVSTKTQTTKGVAQRARLPFTLNEKYNGFRFRFHGMRLILVRNCKFFSAFGSSAGQNLTAVSR